MRHCSRMFPVNTMLVEQFRLAHVLFDLLEVAETDADKAITLLWA